MRYVALSRWRDGEEPGMDRTEARGGPSLEEKSQAGNAPRPSSRPMEASWRNAQGLKRGVSLDKKTRERILRRLL